MRLLAIALLTGAGAVVAWWTGIYWLAALLLVSPLAVISASSVRVIGDDLRSGFGPLTLARGRLTAVTAIRVSGTLIETWQGDDQSRELFFGSAASVAAARGLLASALPRGVRWREPVADLSLGRRICMPTTKLPVRLLRTATYLTIAAAGVALGLAAWRFGVVGFSVLALTIATFAARRTKRVVLLEADGSMLVSRWLGASVRYASTEIRTIRVDAFGVELEARGESFALLASDFPPGGVLAWLLARDEAVELAEDLQGLLEGCRTLGEAMGAR